ncbi:hypothetical protein ACFLS1_03795 [Verrucomicrobiota bacterium]
MDFRRFHNPNICFPIIRRRLGEELLDFVVWYLEVCATRGRSLTWNQSFPNRNAYNQALYRLRKAGLVVYKRRSDGKVFLSLTQAGNDSLPNICKPEQFWRKKWNGIWYILVYDIPEKHRDYRDTLRRFLNHVRMGCLQRSVYVTPRDIRPEYADLMESAKIGKYAFLFESQTVLGQSPMDIVESAWDFGKLNEAQQWYCDVYTDNLEKVLLGKLSTQSLQNLAREEMSAYVTVMHDDPLLPKELLPRNYCGGAVWGLHKKIVKEIGRRL